MDNKIKRISWEHSIETYQGNKKNGRDWFLIYAVAFLIGFGLSALAVLLWI